MYVRILRWKLWNVLSDGNMEKNQRKVRIEYLAIHVQFFLDTPEASGTKVIKHVVGIIKFPKTLDGSQIAKMRRLVCVNKRIPISRI